MIKQLSSQDPAKIFRRSLFFTFTRLILLLFITVGALVFLSISMKKEVKSLSNLRGEQRWLLRGVENIATLSTQKMSIRSLKIGLEEIFPNSLEVPLKTVPQIRSIATRNAIAQIGIAVEETRESDGSSPGSVSVSVGGEGTLQNIKNFIRDVETMGTVVAFKTFSIAPLENGKRFVMKSEAIVHIR